MDSCFEFLKVIQRAFCQPMLKKRNILTNKAQPREDTSITAKEDRVDYDQKQFQLRSQSFLFKAQELFDIDLCLRKGIKEDNPRNVNLFLDSAVELMMRKSCRNMLYSHSLHLRMCETSAHFSIEELAEEIIVEIEKFSIHHMVDSANNSRDRIQIKLERDLQCKGLLLNSIWDFCWDECICIEEAEQEVALVGDYILSQLVEEIAEDLML